MGEESKRSEKKGGEKKGVVGERTWMEAWRRETAQDLMEMSRSLWAVGDVMNPIDTVKSTFFGRRKRLGFTCMLILLGQRWLV